MTDRSGFTTRDCVRDLWNGLGLPEDVLNRLELKGGDDVASPSSFKIGHLAQACVGVSGLAAALLHSVSDGACRQVSVDRQHAVAEFQTEKLYTLEGGSLVKRAGSIGGLYQTTDGYVRVHNGFPNLVDAALKLVGCKSGVSKEEFAAEVRKKSCQELEDGAVKARAVIYTLRTFEEWDESSQGKAVADFPVTVTKLANSPFPRVPKTGERALEGIRVVEMSRVLAAPVAGRAFAVHGADIIWVTSPNLPNQPDLDIDTSRGKRTVQLDIGIEEDKQKLLRLVDGADIFLQSYRPGSLAARGLGPEELLARRGRKPLIYARLTAWGTKGPWTTRRGFDSIVQTVSGFNISEAEYHGSGQTARPLPCQAHDHGAGYLLSLGIMAALHRQLTEGGSYIIDVSLAGVMKYLRSLGRYEDKSCFTTPGYNTQKDVPPEWLETRKCGFGTLTALKHPVTINGLQVNWQQMPKSFGSDNPEWLTS